jgi:hypothetical protein
VQIVLAAAKRIEPLREAIAKLDLDQHTLSRLELYAQAAGQAQALYELANAPPAALQQVYERALEFRALLHSDASNLARAGLLNRDAVKSIKNEVGFLNVGYDLIKLVSLLRDAADRVSGRTVVPVEGWNEAELLANQLVQLAAYREQRRGDPKLGENRLRAVTLMVKAYEQTRRAVQYVRFDFGDAELFAPSIYTGKSIGRKREEPPGAPTGDSVTAPDAGAAPVPSVAEEPAVPGGPGGNPFA